MNYIYAIFNHKNELVLCCSNYDMAAAMLNESISNGTVKTGYVQRVQMINN